VTQPARQRFSFDEYVRLEEDANVKHEFLDGEVWAMAGGSPEHAAIAGNVIALLGAALRDRPCRVYTEALRVRVKETGLATYPDASVVCDRLELDPDDAKGHTAIDPTFLLEVLSPSTEAYDRGEKLAHYKRIPTLREVMLVSHEGRHIELWQRTGAGWACRRYTEGETVELRSLGCALPVEEVYRDPLAG
jgi:Uma2 family endonuclease